MRPHPLLSLLGAACLAACGGGDTASRSANGAAPDTASAAPPPAAAAAGPATSATSRGTVPLRIEATVGGRSYRASGLGECTHTADASIYEMPAAQWAARYSAESGEITNLNLTIWQPKSGGPDQFNLSMRTGSTESRVATVKGGEIVGAGSAGARPNGSAGTLTAEGTDAAGTPVRVSVTCERFPEPIAEGG
jgi:hypothetical protein